MSNVRQHQKVKRQAHDPLESYNIPVLMAEMGMSARKASQEICDIDHMRRQKILQDMGRMLEQNIPDILAANALDLESAQKKNLSVAMLDRLRLTAERIHAIAQACFEIADLDDPLHQVLAQWQRPNGLSIQRVSVPLGVIGIIYESRPNVTVDAAALCFKSGNAVILRSGSESFYSSSALVMLLREALAQNNVSPECIQFVPTKDRDAVGALLRLDQFVDVIIPRGGKSLVARVGKESTIPVLKHLDGINHTYIHTSADVAQALRVTVNAKMRRVSVCGATETILIDRQISETLLPDLLAALCSAGCEIRGDENVRAIAQRHAISVTRAEKIDWETEYLQAIVSVKIVEDLAGACAHINQYGSQHTEAIIATDPDALKRFSTEIDAAIIMQNTSTQFADGGEFGMGAEIGISTGKIHARGPVGVMQLTSMKYIVHSDGMARP